MPMIAARKPVANRMRQPQPVNASGAISDLTTMTKPKPRISPIGMANPTHAPQNARCLERAACSTTQVAAVPNSAPKLMPCSRRKKISSAGAATRCDRTSE
jgi:hypothetical protein